MPARAFFGRLALPWELLGRGVGSAHVSYCLLKATAEGASAVL